MAKLPKGPTAATAAEYPFYPTQDAYGEPTCCHCCGRRSDNLGLGTDRLQKRAKDDPRFVCAQCAIVVGRLSNTRRLDMFELRALDGAVDAVGDYLNTVGMYDLSLFDELQQRMLCKAAVQGFGDALRRELESSNAPF
jgi:hypothetical protein